MYADVGHLTDDSMAFAHRLLSETGVALAPGIDFDTAEGSRFVRMSFAGSRRRRRSCPHEARSLVTVKETPEMSGPPPVS